MGIKESQAGAVTVLALDGRLDAMTGPALEQRVQEIVARPRTQGVTRAIPDVVLDCSALTYASSAGLRAILIAARQLSAAGASLALAAVGPAVQEIFTVSGLAKVLTLSPTLDDALARLPVKTGSTAVAPSAPATASVGSPSSTSVTDSTGLTLVEEMALLAVDQESGRLLTESAIAFHCALAGAAIADLMLMGRLDADLEQFVVIDPTPTGNPILDGILKSLVADESSRRVDAWVTAIGARGQELADRTFDRLISHGVLRREDRKLLWVFTGHRYRTLDGQERQEVKARLTALLLSDEIPDARDAVLVGLLETAGLTHKVMTEPALRNRRERIEALTHLDVVGVEVSRAVDRLLESLNMAISMFRVV